MFAFERFNGILGQFPTNNRSIEVQMMKHFFNDQQVMWPSFPYEHKQDFEDVFSFRIQERGTLYDHQFSANNAEEIEITDFSLFCPTHRITLPHSYTQSIFYSDDLSVLKKLYSKILQRM